MDINYTIYRDKSLVLSGLTWRLFVALSGLYGCLFPIACGLILSSDLDLAEMCAVS